MNTNEGDKIKKPIYFNDIILGEIVQKLNAIAALDDITREKGYILAEAREAVQELLVNNRLKKNTEGGYWTLSFDLSAIDHAQVGKI